MKGSELIFMAPRSRRHGSRPVLDAVLQIADRLGIQPHTRRVNAEGSGSSGKLHSAHFLELADEPEELSFVLDEEAADRLAEAVRTEKLYVFLLRRQVEYEQMGGPAA